ncbi:serine/threonine protein kinase [Streptomyces sp. NBC_00569]|uniref:serine/threonine-protein kinase n=1 Tax=Streptomyces sp. NBC_00569 TaxID=2975780 RepID=UPI002E811224|nr:serine/threonine-protein kinase [Streptomyces sp. NBC_00569]WUB92308.1 serine/threonine protein kinase [Streptomyces sp. NBC_00569]
MNQVHHAADVFQPLQAEDPPVVAGYRLAARLGAGGMGRVYLSHTQGGRPVAIKVVRPELADDPDFRRRFGREIKAARRVRGAYTAELIDADADGVPPWLATLYVPGPSLAQAVARQGPLPVPALLWLMAGVAEALQAIHAEGIVHRDLKPSNVLLAADGPRVIDFGIALAADGTSYTATGNMIGTPAYMAPEQATGDEATAATDVFALGQTAAFAALGRPLYGDGSGVNLLYRIVHSEPDLSLLPEPLRPLFARCLAADPAERATPAEIVGWCRRQLGADADEGGGPAVWREITGPEFLVPPPVPDPTPVYPQALAGYPLPLTGYPQPTLEERKARRRRSMLITAVGVTAGTLIVTALAWTVMDAKDRIDHRDTTGASTSSTSATGADTRPSGSSSASAPGSSSDSSDLAGPGTGDDRASGTSSSSSARPQEPKPEPYPLVWLDTKNSVSLKDPDAARKNRTGDIRFGCKSAGCELDSDTSVFLQLYGKPGGTLDECRLMLKHEKNHRLPLAGAANGSEICIKNPSGDIALFVIGTKSTAMPDIGFLQGDLTIWRGAA